MDCSVIIPAYNPGDYIFDLLSDLEIKTPSAGNCFEEKISSGGTRIYIVDDFSTDGSIERVRRSFADMDNLTVIRMDQKAGEAHVPRFRGVCESSSTWIIPIDADDRLEKDYVAKMLKRREETGAEIVLPIMRGFTNDLSGSWLYAPVEDFDTSKVYHGRDLIKETLGDWRISGNGGLYSRDLFVDCGRDFFPAKGFIYNDEIFFRHVLGKARRVAFADAIYFYRINPNSGTQTPGIKKFDLIEKNRLLRDFVASEFGKGSEEWERVMVQSFHQLIEQFRLFNTLPPKTPFASEVFQKLEKEQSALSEEDLKGKVSSRLLFISKFPTKMALPLLKCYDCIRRVPETARSENH